MSSWETMRKSPSMPNWCCNRNRTREVGTQVPMRHPSAHRLSLRLLLSACVLLLAGLGCNRKQASATPRSLRLHLSLWPERKEVRSEAKSRACATLSA